jgi:hypothetical protein
MVTIGWQGGPEQYEFIESYGQHVLPLIRERKPAVAPTLGVA